MTALYLDLRALAHWTARNDIARAEYHRRLTTIAGQDHREALLDRAEAEE